jgi:glycerol-1-phosphate dehydrogenase [NAD(P)+]
VPRRRGVVTVAVSNEARRVGTDPLDALLRGEWRDPDDGASLRVPVRAVVIAESLAGTEGDLVDALGLGRRLAVVSDPDTHRALGERVESALAKQATIVRIVLERNPHADLQTARAVRRASALADALVAVGSGTINDLCKYAAALDAKPYAVFATAPSMNGYASINAAITIEGHKKTLKAAAPLGIFIDLDVLARAPPRLIRAGLGDSLCRATAQSDWLLSHHLRGTEYRRAPFALLAADEPALLDAPEALMRGDLGAMQALARTLVLSGCGMTVVNGSYPASQGEHLISHYIDMFAPADRPPFLHGEQVGVATLTMARIQEAILAQGPPVVRASTVTRDDLVRGFGAVGPACWDEFVGKRLDAERAAAFNARIAEAWPRLRSEIAAIGVSTTRIAEVLERAGCPSRPRDIGLTEDFYARAVREARYVRDRYTFLDLAADAEVLDAVSYRS